MVRRGNFLNDIKPGISASAKLISFLPHVARDISLTLNGIFSTIINFNIKSANLLNICLIDEINLNDIYNYLL